MKIPYELPVINGKQYEDWRDFFEALHFFGYHTDFTYRDNDTTNVDMFFGHFIASHYLDSNLPLDDMVDEYENESKEVCDEIIESFKQFNLTNVLPTILYK